MLANRVRETSSTAGAGDIALAGASTNSKAFSDNFELNERFIYWIDNALGDWETGEGYLSASSTLVRHAVHDNSLGTKAKIDFTGSLSVFVGDSAHTRANLPDVMINGFGEFPIIYSAHHVGYSTSHTARTNDQITYVPFINEREVKYTGFSGYIKTVEAGKKLRIAVYDYDRSTGLPTGLPLVESADIPLDSAGLFQSPFANSVAGYSAPVKLPKNFFIAYLSDSNVATFAAVGYTQQKRTWVGCNGNGAEPVMYEVKNTVSIGAGPELGVPNVGATRSENYPIFGFYV